MSYCDCKYEAGDILNLKSIKVRNHWNKVVVKLLFLLFVRLLSREHHTLAWGKIIKREQYLVLHKTFSIPQSAQVHGHSFNTSTLGYGLISFFLNVNFLSNIIGDSAGHAHTGQDSGVKQQGRNLQSDNKDQYLERWEKKKKKIKIKNSTAYQIMGSISVKGTEHQSYLHEALKERVLQQKTTYSIFRSIVYICS